MKPGTLTLIAVSVATLILIAGCGQSLQERVEKAKGDAWEEQHATKQAEEDAQQGYRDEWEDFRDAAEAQLSTNAKRLHDITLKIAASDDTVKARIGAQNEALTKLNAELRVRLAGYKDVGKVNWDEFKRDFSHDLDALSKAVKNLTQEDSKR